VRRGPRAAASRYGRWETEMPFCKICRRRIDVSRTGVVAYRCRVCGAVCCGAHYLPERRLCVRCANVSEEKVRRMGAPFRSATRSDAKDAPRRKR